MVSRKAEKTCKISAGQCFPDSKRMNGLPLNFFSISVPEEIASRTANSFDITNPSLEGLKLYRLYQAYNVGFGLLCSLPDPRYT